MGSILETVYGLPFNVVEVPNIKLKRPGWLKQPSAMVVYSFVLVSYFLVCGGIHSIDIEIIYQLLNNK